MINRRLFLSSAAGVGGMLSLGNVSFADEINKDENQKSVLFLFLAGGATHIETFNPIPNAPSDRRSVTGHVKTNVPGMELGGLFKELAKKGDQISIFRGFHHRDSNHASATHWVVTGEANFGAGTTQKWPSYGSVVSGYHGTNADNGLPHYVKVRSIQHDDAAWMGAKHMGYDATREGRRDLQLSSEASRFKARLKTLEMIDKSFDSRGAGLAKEWTDLRAQAVKVLFGEAAKAFKIEQDKEYDNFKEQALGKELLTSVRLIEAGSKFVTVSFGGWDMHNNIFNSLTQRQTVLDQYLSKLIDLLEQRGLSEKTMLVVTSEFGRTPKVNSNGGRDHWSNLAPLLISSKSHTMGRVVGKSSVNAETVDEGECFPEDLRWTMFDHLGIDRHMKWTSTDGRPMTMVKEDAKNILTEL